MLCEAVGSKNMRWLDECQLPECTAFRGFFEVFHGAKLADRLTTRDARDSIISRAEMSYHLRIPDGLHPEVWWIDETEARRIGIGNPKQGLSAPTSRQSLAKQYGTRFIARHLGTLVPMGNGFFTRPILDPANFIRACRAR
jgi:hypothetical protein